MMLVRRRRCGRFLPCRPAAGRLDAAFELRVAVDDRHVRIEVHDGTARNPVRRYFSDTASSGRGLRLIEELSDAWGVEPDPGGGGKTVWAEVNLTGPAGPVESFALDAVDSL